MTQPIELEKEDGHVVVPILPMTPCAINRFTAEIGNVWIRAEWNELCWVPAPLAELSDDKLVHGFLYMR